MGHAFVQSGCCVHVHPRSVLSPPCVKKGTGRAGGCGQWGASVALDGAGWAGVQAEGHVNLNLEGLGWQGCSWTQQLLSGLNQQGLTHGLTGFEVHDVIVGHRLDHDGW